MQENVAKNGWELTKVARIGRSRWLYGQKRVEGGVGQSREPKLSVCCLHSSSRPFLAKKRPGAPVFGHCPLKNDANSIFFSNFKKTKLLVKMGPKLRLGRERAKKKTNRFKFNHFQRGFKKHISCTPGTLITLSSFATYSGWTRHPFEKEKVGIS